MYDHHIGFGSAAVPVKFTGVWGMHVPTVGSFFFAGIPSELGINGMSVDEVAEVSVYITPNKIHGWDTTSTLASN